MINLTLDGKEYQIKNRFDEITLKDFDYIINQSTSGLNEIQIRKNLLTYFSKLTIELIDMLSVKTFEEVTGYFFIDGQEHTVAKPIKIKGYTIPIKNSALDLPVKSVSSIEKIFKSDSKEKLVMSIANIYNTGEYDAKLYNEVEKAKASDFIWIIKQLENFVDVNIK